MAPKWLLAGRDAGVALSSAGHALDAQRACLAAEGIAAVGASWIRKPWGAMSPQAVVDPAATLAGPLLLGSGCWVDRGAELGPQAVLSRDVVVLAGTTLHDTLLLPKTCVGAGLELAGLRQRTVWLWPSLYRARFTPLRPESRRSIGHRSIRTPHEIRHRSRHGKCLMAHQRSVPACTTSKS